MSLQMPVPLDPVIVPDQPRFDGGGQLHIEVEEVDREGDGEDAEQDKQQLPQKPATDFHFLCHLEP